MNSSGQQNGSGPCGACKFLRRKCVKGCIFAPYFDPEQGTSHFAAVHKVFGASNASKMLLRVPANKRLDVVVTLCYEALARIRDPVYGCVGHLFTLQQQVVNLQAELACAQARLCTLHRLPPHQMLPLPTMQFSPSPTNLDQPCSSNVSLQASMEMASCFADSINDQQQDLEDGDDDLHALAQGFVSKYLHGGVKFNCKPSTSP